MKVNKKKSSVSLNLPLIILLYVAICPFLNQNHCFLKCKTTYQCKTIWIWFKFVYKFTSMCVFYQDQNTLLIYIFHVRTSFRNLVKPENILKTYSLMTYLGFYLKYLKKRGEKGGREVKPLWQNLNNCELWVMGMQGFFELVPHILCRLEFSSLKIILLYILISSIKQHN